MAAHFKMVAGVLAIGALILGTLCAGFIIEGNTLLSALIFGPGYVVAAGYVRRWWSTPSIAWRRAIWGVSGLVQGAWLFTFGFFVLKDRGFGGGELTFLIWWAFAFDYSVYGFLSDTERAT